MGNTDCTNQKHTIIQPSIKPSNMFKKRLCVFFGCLFISRLSIGSGDGKDTSSIWIRGSVFDFEQKLLEKLVYLKSKMVTLEKMVNEIEIRFDSQVNTALERLANTTDSTLSSWRQERSVFLEGIVDLQTKSESLYQNWTLESKTQLGKIRNDMKKLDELSRERIQEFRQDLDKVKGSVVGPSAPVFSANSLKSDSNLKGKTMIYPNVDINVGGGYDSSTGIFKAPVAGTYLFKAQMSVEAGDYLKQEIIAAGKTIGVLVFKNTSDKNGLCVSGDGFAVLSKGDTVYVKTTDVSSDGDLLYVGSTTGNFFSGILVHQ